MIPPRPTMIKAVPAAPLLVWPWSTMKFAGSPFMLIPLLRYLNVKVPLAVL